LHPPPYFDYTDTASRLRSHREAKQITQDDMARLLDMSFTMYRNIEAGKRPLTVPTLLKLCNILDIEAHQLAPGLAGTNYIITQTANEQANAGGGMVINQQNAEAWQAAEQAYKMALTAKDQTISTLEEIVEILKRQSDEK
jgi:transcriptional regulator with XRE-family HTH domain